MSDEKEMLALNTTTGRVHKYRGTVPGGIMSDDYNLPVGIKPCGCESDHFREAVEQDNLIVIRRKQYEVSIWEPAPCMDDAE